MQALQEPVYSNAQAGAWLHARTGKRACEWLAEPDIEGEF